MDFCGSNFEKYDFNFYVYFLASNLLAPPPPIEALPIFEAPPPLGAHAGAAPPPTAKYVD